MREEGFYWVNMEGVWAVAEWTGYIWWLTGSPEHANDDDFEEINENRLTHE